MAGDFGLGVGCRACVIIAASRIGAAEIDLPQIGVTEIRLEGFGALHTHPVQRRVLEACAILQPAPAKIRVAEIAAREVAATQVSGSKVGIAQIHARHVAASQIGPRQSTCGGEGLDSLTADSWRRGPSMAARDHMPRPPRSRPLSMPWLGSGDIDCTSCSIWLGVGRSLAGAMSSPCTPPEAIILGVGLSIAGAMFSPYVSAAAIWLGVVSVR